MNETIYQHIMNAERGKPLTLSSVMLALLQRQLTDDWVDADERENEYQREINDLIGENTIARHELARLTARDGMLQQEIERLQVVIAHMEAETER